MYNVDHRITTYHNRIKSHHIGLRGSPTNEINYRVLYTHIKSLGSYTVPIIDPLYANYFLLEVGYAPKRVDGLSLQASLGANTGKLLGNQLGGLLTLRWNGTIRKTPIATRIIDTISSLNLLPLADFSLG
jgi:hypothetical protein